MPRARNLNYCICLHMHNQPRHEQNQPVEKSICAVSRFYSASLPFELSREREGINNTPDSCHRWALSGSVKMLSWTESDYHQGDESAQPLKVKFPVLRRTHIRSSKMQILSS